MGKGDYEQVPGTGQDDYFLIDPTGHTSDFMNRYMAGLGDPANRYDSTQEMDEFLANFGRLQGSITDATSPLSAQLNKQVTDLTNQAVGEIGQTFSGMNSLYSSGMGTAAGSEAGRIASQAGTQLAQAQLGMLGGLAGQNMGDIASGYRSDAQNRLTELGIGAQLFAPNYASPEYEYQEGGWDKFMGGLGNMGGFLGGAAKMMTGLGGLL